jgi:hypothetical protein
MRVTGIKEERECVINERETESSVREERESRWEKGERGNK